MNDADRDTKIVAPTSTLRVLKQLDVYLSSIELEEPTELSIILETNGEKTETIDSATYHSTVTVGIALHRLTNSARISIGRERGAFTAVLDDVLAPGSTFPFSMASTYFVHNPRPNSSGEYLMLTILDRDKNSLLRLFAKPGTHQ